MNGETVECPASVDYDTSSGKLVIPTTNDDPGAAHKQLKVSVHIVINVVQVKYRCVSLFKLIKYWT